MNFARMSILTLASSIAAVLSASSATAQDPLVLSNAVSLRDAAVSPVEMASSSNEAALPDAPGYQSTTASRAGSNTAPLHEKYISAGEIAQPITAHDKVVIGLKDLYSPGNFIAIFASSGYEQIANGEPNYGTDRGAYGERLGAAAIRETSQGIFTDMVFAPILHEDPRYYVQGQGHSFIHRTLYAITRPLITRTDGGKSTVNGALLMGYASSAALSYAYYPKVNQNFQDTASTFGGSIGGAALGFLASEFTDDVLRSMHLKK